MGMMFAPEEPTGDGFAGEKGPTRGLDEAGGDPRVQTVRGPLVRRIYLRPELGRWRGEGVWRSLGGGVGCARVCEWVRTCERVWVTERVSLGPDRCGKQPRMSFLALLGPHTHTFPLGLRQ